MFRHLFPVMLLLIPILNAQASEAVYEQNFEEEEVDDYPMDFLVLEGDFTVQEEEGNKFLRLPGTPLGSFALLFGTNETEGFEVSARIRSEKTKRRFPSFAVGVNGVSGYKLRVDPNKRSLEILKRDEESLVQIPYKWTSGSWTWLKIRIRKAADSKWMIEGKAWEEGAEEPGDWMISYEETEEPVPGKFSIWGKPFSEKPIDYDDLKAVKID
ncbi:MAG: hypothetical protein H6751_11735 [Candidatus Omnitrophica bacterium]|nr:hypothetical protein [Candidatus Omnitrophota bacterium]MCB9783624.1 hypothetical protein [Candidatus Omnitrophota bacterium]